MIHPHTEVRYISKEKGYGVVATKLIPKGTITWAMDPLDQVFSPEAIEGYSDVFKEIFETYSFRDNRGNLILCWDNSRYVNHSFNSNCISTAYDFELAVRDIHPGEELTDDYGYLNISEPFQAMKEEGSDRNMVMPDDLLKYHKVWDKKLISAFKLFYSVDQPLKKIIRPDVFQKMVQISKGKEKMDSILNCYFYPDKQLNGHPKKEKLKKQ